MNKLKSLKYIVYFMELSLFLNYFPTLQASYGYYRSYHKPQENSENNNQLHQAVLNDDEQSLRALLQSSHWQSKVNKMNQDRLTPLHLAIRRGNVGMVQALLQAGSNIHQAIQAGNSRYYSDLEYGDTALGLALSQKVPNDQIIEALISYGASTKEVLTRAVQERKESLVRLLLKSSPPLELTLKNSLFHQALNQMLHSYKENTSKHRPILDLILKLNPDINSKDTYQEQTALHQAVKAQQIDLVILFLQKGASISLKNKEGQTPFHLALNIGDSNIADLLIKQGADIHERQNDGKTVFRLAIDQMLRHGYGESVTLTGYGLNHSHRISRAFLEMLLEKGVDINTPDHQGITPLHAALNQRSLDFTLLDFLLDAGADPNAVTQNGQTPLYLAVEHNAPLSFVKNLVNRGAQVKLSDGHAVPLLHRALSNKEEEVATFLLEAGSQVNAVSKTGQTTLLLAIEQRMSLDFIERLIEKGADIDQENERGITPLHHSLISHQADIAQFLINKGANVRKSQKNGKTPLHYALEMNQNNDLIESFFHQPRASKQSSSDQLIKDLIDKGADIDSYDDNLNTPLHLALQLSDLKSAIYLIEQKANVTAANSKGVTPLHLALEKGYFKITRYFIHQGADVNAIQHEGKAPLHCAFRRGFSKDLFKIEKVASTKKEQTDKKVSYQVSGIVPLLLAKGADINALDASSTSVLHLALQAESLQFAVFLLKRGIDLNVQQQAGHTPLSLVVHKRLNAEARIKHDTAYTNLFFHLLQAGADPNCPQDSTLNPFYQAWTKRDGMTAKVLLKYGAKPLNPFDHSTSQRSQNSFSSFMTVSSFDPLQEAIKSFEPRVVGCLLKHGAQIEPQLFQTLLDQLTLDRDPLDLMLEFAKHGGFQNRKNQESKSFPLTISSETEETENSQTKQAVQKDLTARDCQLMILKLLLSYGVDPNLPDETGQSPLAKAYLNGQEPQQDVIDLLQQAGAHLYRASYKGKPLLDKLTKQALLNSVKDQGPVPSLCWLAHQKVLSSFRGEKENIEMLQQALKHLPTQLQEQYFPEFMSKEDQTEEDYVGDWLSYKAVQQRIQARVEAEAQARRQAYFQNQRSHWRHDFNRNDDSDDEEDRYGRRSYSPPSSDSDDY